MALPTGALRSAAGSAAMMAMKQLGIRFDPALNFKYYVELEGVIAAEFLQCGGLTVQRDVKIVEEGGINNYVHVLPGRIKHSNIVLKHGIGYSRELWRWFHTGIYDGKVDKINMSVILGNAEGKKAKHWDIIKAFPVKWSGPDLRSDAREVAIETIEIAHHGIDLSVEIMTPMSLAAIFS